MTIVKEVDKNGELMFGVYKDSLFINREGNKIVFIFKKSADKYPMIVKFSPLEMRKMINKLEKLLKERS